MPIYKGFIPLQDPYPYKYMTARKTERSGKWPFASYGQGDL